MSYLSTHLVLPFYMSCPTFPPVLSYLSTCLVLPFYLCPICPAVACPILPVQLFLVLLAEEVQLGHDVDMGKLQVDHGGQCCHHAGHKLGRLQQELGIQEEDATQPEVPVLQLVGQLPHDGDVCVQLNLTCSASRQRVKLNRDQKQRSLLGFINTNRI